MHCVAGVRFGHIHSLLASILYNTTAERCLITLTHYHVHCHVKEVEHLEVSDGMYMFHSLASYTTAEECPLIDPLPKRIPPRIPIIPKCITPIPHPRLLHHLTKRRVRRQHIIPRRRLPLTRDQWRRHQAYTNSLR